MLEVGEVTFGAHRCVLAARSSVFKAEFNGSEKMDPSVRMEDTKKNGR
jgi:hypothetical protein